MAKHPLEVGAKGVGAESHYGFVAQGVILQLSIAVMLFFATEF